MIVLGYLISILCFVIGTVRFNVDDSDSGLILALCSFSAGLACFASTTARLIRQRRARKMQSQA
jgi:hypothetical protein